MSICSAKGPEGFLCILKVGHPQAHLSLDNRVDWHGSPGAPIEWSPTPVSPTRSTSPGAAVRIAQAKGYTGEICGHCGSPNTVRIGKCLRCDSCQQIGECG